MSGTRTKLKASSDDQKYYISNSQLDQLTDHCSISVETRSLVWHEEKTEGYLVRINITILVIVDELSLVLFAGAAAYTDCFAAEE